MRERERERERERTCCHVGFATPADHKVKIKNRGHPVSSIAENGQNTVTSPGDLKRLTVIWTPVKNAGVKKKKQLASREIISTTSRTNLIHSCLTGSLHSENNSLIFSLISKNI